jgi:hypothetical protein
MGTRLQWIGSVSLAFGLLATVAPGHAQSPRPWVDPPPEVGAPPSTPSSAPVASETKPTTSQPALQPAATSAAAKPNEAAKEQAKQRTEEAPSSVKETQASKSLPRKALTERKDRRQTRSATSARSERSKQTVQRREVADQKPRGTRAERIREGVNAGLEVMTLRTIEFPDGRRVQILTRPGQGAISELMEAPE